MTLSRKNEVWHSGRRYLLKTLAAVLLSGLSLAVHGWSENGHRVVVEQALDQLSLHERERLNRIAQHLVDQAPALKRLQKRHGATPPLVLTAAWLDKQRGREVGEIFARYGDLIPPPLRSYSKTTTDDWHYSNLLYGDQKTDRRQCRAINSGELNKVLPILPRAFASASGPQDKAIVLAFFVHLVADAHQPLHGITRAMDECEHDRGGNRFCVSTRSQRGRCNANLHQLWDSGFGNFHSNSGGRELPGGTGKKYDRLQKQLRPEDWQKENLALAETIYNTPEGRVPDAEYQQWASGVVRQRVGLAAARLALLLSQMLTAEGLEFDAEKSDAAR